MTARLVSVQPLKQAYMRQPLAHQIDIDFVGQQDGFASHYATLIHEDVSTYLSDRCQEPLTAIRVDTKVSEAAKITSDEPTRIPVLQSAINSQYVFDNRRQRGFVSGSNEAAYGSIAISEPRRVVV